MDYCEGNFYNLVYLGLVGIISSDIMMFDSEEYFFILSEI